MGEELYSLEDVKAGAFRDKIYLSKRINRVCVFYKEKERKKKNNGFYIGSTFTHIMKTNSTPHR